MKIYIPKVRLGAVEDAAAAKRKEIMERLKRGEIVTVTPNGQIAVPENNSQGGNYGSAAPSLTVPAGKLA